MLIFSSISLTFILSPFLLLILLLLGYFPGTMLLCWIIVACFIGKLIGSSLWLMRWRFENELAADHWLSRITRIPWPSERLLLRGWAGSWFGRRFAWPPLVLFLFGVCILAAGPCGYYRDFNQYVERLEERGWGVTGISWVQAYNFGRSGPMLIGYTASAYFAGLGMASFDG